VRAPILPRHRRLATLALVCAAIAGWQTSCGSSARCDLDGLLRQQAGPGAVDCGRVAIGATTAAVDQCIADQSARGGAFHARYDVQGVDSSVSLGASRDASGRASVFTWDSDPSGGSNSGPRITETPCTGDPPILTRLDRSDVFSPVFCNVAGEMSTACGR
jgi:hypothetical protein